MNSSTRLGGATRHAESHHFRPEQLPEDYLEAILRLAAQAPSGCGHQPWRFIVVREAEARKRFQWTASDQARVGEAPVVVIAFALEEDWKTGLETGIQARVRGGLETPGTPDEMAHQHRALTQFLGATPPAIWVNRQIVIALTTMMLVAEAYGVGTAAMQGYDPEDVKRQFGLPPEADVVALLALGFAEESDDDHHAEPPLRDFVHLERYGQPWQAEAN